MDSHSLAVNQGLGRAPAKAHKLGVAKHWVQVLQKPRFSFWVYKQKNDFANMTSVIMKPSSILYRLGILSHILYPRLLSSQQTSSSSQHSPWLPEMIEINISTVTNCRHLCGILEKHEMSTSLKILPNAI